MFWLPNTIPPTPRLSKALPNTTAFWAGSDSEDAYVENLGHELYGPDSITYQYNSYGYRSEEFIYDPSEFRLLIFGCSFAAGIGLPLHETVGHYLKMMIQQRLGKTVRLYNMALGGSNNDAIVMRAYSACPVLKPDLVFCWWSFLNRRQWFVDDTEINFGPGFSYHAPSIYDAHKAYVALSNDKADWYQFVRNYKMFDLIMSDYQIPWISTSVENIHRYTNEDVADYIKIGHFLSFGDLGCGPRARDHRHPGRECHQKLAEALMLRFETMYFTSLCKNKLSVL